MSDRERWKGDALIRSHFHVNPEELQVSEWNKLYAQAVWIEEFRLKNNAEILKALFNAFVG